MPFTSYYRRLSFPSNMQEEEEIGRGPLARAEDHFPTVQLSGGLLNAGAQMPSVVDARARTRRCWPIAGDSRSNLKPELRADSQRTTPVMQVPEPRGLKLVSLVIKTGGWLRMAGAQRVVAQWRDVLERGRWRRGSFTVNVGDYHRLAGSRCRWVRGGALGDG